MGVILEAGTRVRLRNDPSTIGLVMDRPHREIRGRIFVSIELPSGCKELPLTELEAVPEGADALRDFVAGKLSNPDDLRRTITHLRMTGKLADMIYSIGATNTEFHAYQFKPVLKLLNSPSRGLLIADEVGLGKTIEAGLIWTELVARFDCRRLLIVCPKPLTQKWQEELRSKFNVDARICSAAELLDALKDDNSRREGFAAIASMSAIRPPKNWNDPDSPAKGARADLARYMADADQELFDLAVFDEAHHLRNTETLNHRLGKLVSEAADYTIYLSATPINLRANDLRAILKLIDPETFEREWLFDILQAENAPMIAALEAARNPKVSMADVKRLVDDLPAGQVLKTGGRLKRLREELAKGKENTPANRVAIAARIEEMSLLGSLINRTRRRDVAEFRVERRPHAPLWKMSDAERDFYDAASNQIANYALRNDINERFLLAQTQRFLASSLASAYRHWGERTGSLEVDEETDDETDSRQKHKLPGPLIQALGDICVDPAQLRALETGDSKFAILKAQLSQIRARDPDQRIIIFSSFRRSIAYLARRLKMAGYETMELHGGIKADRKTTVDQFADSPGGTILLTSEVGGEGLDLQFCRILFNWDLPWNPMKVEQRIGRIDRIGQQSPSIEIINLIATDTIEQQVYERLYDRLGIIRQALGDFEPILGEMLHDIELVLSDPKLTAEQRAAELDRATHAAEQRKRQNDELEREAPGLIAHGDSIVQRIKDAQAPHKRLTSADLRDYVSSILGQSYEGTRIEQIPHIDIEAFDIRLSARAQAEFERFRTQNIRRYPTKFSRDAAKGVKVIFGSNPDPQRYRSFEAVPMTHPLARFCARIREEAQRGMMSRPATAFQIARLPSLKVKSGTYAIAVQSWSIDGLIPVDRLTFQGVNIATHRLLPADESEQMLMEALMSQPRMLSCDTATRQHAAEAISQYLMPALEEAWEDFRETTAADHFDRVDTQRALILEHKERHTRDYNARVSDLRFSSSLKQRNMIPAIEGKHKKFLARMDIKLAEIEQRENSLTFEEPRLVGIALVTMGMN